MKKIILVSVLTLMFGIIGLAQDPGWPRQKQSPAGKFVYYQPQVDDWSNYKELEFSMAFSLTLSGGKKTVGVVNFQATTDYVVYDHAVVINNSSIARTI